VGESGVCQRTLPDLGVQQTIYVVIVTRDALALVL